MNTKNIPSDSKMLLSDLQELALWRSVIPAKWAHLACTAKAAWQAQRLYSISPDALIEPFATWSQTFQALQQKHNTITQAELHAKRHGPASQQIVKKIQKPLQSTPCVMRFKNSDQEIRAMAHWAQQKQPASRVTCFVPHLSVMGDRIERLFQENMSSEDYHMAVQRPLIQEGLIQSALHALALRNGDFSRERLESFFLSPYLHYTEMNRVTAAISYHALQHATHIDHTVLSAIFKKKENWQQYWEIELPTAPCSFTCWSTLFHVLLNSLGWPGDRALNTHELAIMKYWEKGIHTLSGLDAYLPNSDYSEALEILQLFCENTYWTPSTENPGIQIVDLAETLKIVDCVWLMGLDEATWPPQPVLNPLLPAALQKQKRVDALLLQNQLFEGSTEVMISYSEAARPSALIKNIPLSPAPMIASSRYVPRVALLDTTLKSSLDTDNIDNMGPSISPSERIQGGSHILALQARCPFRAFATLRLHAHPIPPPAIGLSARQRGILCHAALCAFWKNIQSQERLCALSPEKQSEAIISAIETGIFLSTQKMVLPPLHFLAIEKKRLTALLSAWLEIEKKRPPFKILEVETTRDVTIHALRFKIQIDRIDVIGKKNHHIVIDYKTGTEQGLQHWFDERMTDPQLPLYALFATTQVCGLAYASIKSPTLYFRGLIDGESFSKVQSIETYFKNTQTWKQLTELWYQKLSQLSDAFFHGKANVDPADPSLCDRCHLPSLCRHRAHDV